MKPEEPVPESLFLDFCISETRYGDAIFARYHMDGRAQNGL